MLQPRLGLCSASGGLPASRFSMALRRSAPCAATWMVGWRSTPFFASLSAVGPCLVELGVVDQLVVDVEEVKVGRAGGVKLARRLLRRVLQVGNRAALALIPTKSVPLRAHAFGTVFGKLLRVVGADADRRDFSRVLLHQRGEGFLHVDDERAVRGYEGDQQALPAALVVDAAEDVIAAERLIAEDALKLKGGADGADGQVEVGGCACHGLMIAGPRSAFTRSSRPTSRRAAGSLQSCAVRCCAARSAAPRG